MVVEKILKELTPERIKKEIEAIQNVKLPAELQKWVDEYNKVGKRDIFFWQWIYQAIQKTTFSSIKIKYQKSILKSEFLLVMFIILLDDIVDKTKNIKLLSELLKISYEKDHIFKKLDQKDKIYLKFTIKVWQEVNKIIKKYPNYKKFKDIFDYDVNQIINAMNYDYLINNNYYLINQDEYWLYSPHTMQIIAAATIDLMCFPEFNIHELGVFRKFVYLAQKMGRMGNCLYTWEREIKDNDFTSGVVAYAAEMGIIAHNKLTQKSQSKLIAKIKKTDIERKILREWNKNYLEINNLAKKIKSIDTKNYILGTKKLFTMYLAAKNKI